MPNRWHWSIGGGSGIGAALAEAYRDRGTPTVTWDIAGSHDVTCDVAEPERIDAAVAATRAAGVSRPG